MAEPTPRNPTAAAVTPELQHEIEQFLYAEARLLDERRYRDWYALLADDLHYVMPLRFNTLARERDHEFSDATQSAWFDETRASIDVRLKRLETGMAWAEEPPSRVRHLITNVTIDDPGEPLTVRSCFHVYRSRLERQVDQFTGERTDVLRRAGTPLGWALVSRRIVLDQSTLLSNNLSLFF
ncbi:MAG: 3-phenylpropionate/cinnamic acid dioxygenase subunit beta [Pseudomonadales bacterium]